MSLLCPFESDDGSDCAATFSVGKLAANVAQRQFGEAVPTIPASYLREEFEARTRLPGVLGTQSMMELQFHSFSDQGAVTPATPASGMARSAAVGFKLLMEHHFHRSCRALYDFGTARLACRRFAF